MFAYLQFLKNINDALLGNKWVMSFLYKNIGSY